MERIKRALLLGAPVVLLPLVNALAAVHADAAWDARAALPWVLGAAAEELFFRRFLLKRLLLDTGALRPAAAVLLSAAVFSAMHLFNLRAGMPAAEVLAQALCAFCFSVWAGAAVHRTGRAAVPLLAHVLLNLTACEGVGPAAPLAVHLLVLLDGALLLLRP